MLIIYTGSFRLSAIRILIDNAYARGVKIYYVQKYKKEEKERRRYWHTRNIYVGKQSAYHMSSDSSFHHRQCRFPKMGLAVARWRSPVLVIMEDTGRNERQTRGATECSVLTFTIWIIHAISTCGAYLVYRRSWEHIASRNIHIFWKFKIFLYKNHHNSKILL